ncbi:hypothetical protein FOMPIDRAFT_1135094, partial [Fomitopsis schrenkii]
RGKTWFCSHCSYHTQREGDMPRHMNTHTANDKFVCCGVPVGDVLGYTGEIRDFEGQAMAGGCSKSFGRKDSFLRHLRVREGQCIRPTYLTSESS